MLEATSVRIAPSILSANFLDLGAELDAISTADFVHFDVMDGNFVPNLSFGIPVLKQVKPATDLVVDAHLMIDNPDSMADSFIEAGADIICFHQEATCHAHRLVGHIHDCGKKAAIALNPGTPANTLESLIVDLDMVLVMTVNPGFGGQRFIDSTLDKIREVRAMCDRKGVRPLIEVDGGINEETAGLVCGAGAKVLVAGSSVFKGDYAANIASLREAGNSACEKRA